MLKVRISTLSPEGLTLQEKLSLESINERVALGGVETPGAAERAEGESEITFIAPPSVTFTVRKNMEGAECFGTVSGVYTQLCGRCRLPVERSIEAKVSYILKPLKNPQEDIDDIGLAYYQGDHFDFEELFQEELIRELSPFWLPDLTEEGVCTACNILPEPLLQEEKEPAHQEKKTQSLGDLLKRSGIKL